MTTSDIRATLARLAAHGARWLCDKRPHWGDAILADGLIYASSALGDAALLDAPSQWFAPKLASGPRLEGWFWFWAAEALPAIDLCEKTRKRELLDYARKIVDRFATASTTPTGAIVPHPPALEAWVDVAYFSAPATARLGRLLRDRALQERALDQVLAHQRALLDSKSGLMWHVAYADRGTHSPCLWARGNSWYSIAASQVLADCSGMSGEEGPEIRAVLARQLNAIVALQDRSGLWHTVIDRPETYLEASCAAGFALALGRALAMKLDDGLDPAEAEIAYERALDAICSKITSDGELTQVSQQTPPGDVAHYNSIEIGSASYGTGVALMALAEWLGSK